jgi:hypothetical protein
LVGLGSSNLPYTGFILVYYLFMKANKKHVHELKRKARRKQKKIDELPDKIFARRDRKENHFAMKEIYKRRAVSRKLTAEERTERNKEILDRFNKGESK